MQALVLGLFVLRGAMALAPPPFSCLIEPMITLQAGESFLTNM